jgi:hypothetical protein
MIYIGFVSAFFLIIFGRYAFVKSRLGSVICYETHQTKVRLKTNPTRGFVSFAASKQYHCFLNSIKLHCTLSFYSRILMLKRKNIAGCLETPTLRLPGIVDTAFLLFFVHTLVVLCNTLWS